MLGLSNLRLSSDEMREIFIVCAKTSVVPGASCAAATFAGDEQHTEGASGRGGAR